jgi:eukaryotic-like serine/threonine-protein kinase
MSQRDLLDTLPSTAGAARDRRHRIGRYVVLEVLGDGAMGVVVSAYDADLDRKVAVKLLRGAAAAGSERLLREARAIARLDHPNVITVHEAGAIDGEVFVAMELAAGGTLRAWIDAAPRSWREVVAVMIQAGRGLWAAHQAGLVHRDFKPANVLLTRAGEVRVADFGLVGLCHDERDAGAMPENVTLTATGALLGTPAYMAPEQHRGEDAGPAADQFAFCVSTWEALHGERPFSGATVAELAGRATAGEIGPPPAGRQVPAWLRGIIERGLRPDPAARWPTMGALLDALERDPEAVRRRRIQLGAAIGGGGLVAGVAVIAATAAIGGAPPDMRCRDLDVPLAGVWDDDRRAGLRTAFAASNRPYAEDAHRRVAERLDRHAARWVAARVEACEATHVRGELSAQLLDLRMTCLDRRLSELSALVDVLGDASDPTVLDRSIVAASALPAIEACADVAALGAATPPPSDPHARARVEALRDRLAEAAARSSAGRHADGLAIAVDVASQASALGYPPVHAEALLAHGRLANLAGDPRGAEPILREALRIAADARDDDAITEAWALLIEVIGVHLGRGDEALQLRIAAETASRRAGPGGEAEARLWRSLAMVLNAQGGYDEARRLAERALAQREAALGADDVGLATYATALGNVLYSQAAYEEAGRQLERAQTLLEMALGPHHPRVGQGLNNLGAIDEVRHDLAAASARFDRAVAVYEAALGPDHPSLVPPLTNRGRIATKLERHGDAIADLERAAAIAERGHGPDAPDLAMALSVLGEAILAGGGDPAAAQRSFERALTIYERALGPGHANVGMVVNNLGKVALAEGRPDEARAQHARAAALFETALGPEHPYVAYALLGVAEASLARLRPAGAIDAVDRAIAILTGGGSPPETIATARLIRVHALWQRGDRDLAREAAQDALDALVAAGAPPGAAGRDLEAWLRDHARR